MYDSGKETLRQVTRRFLTYQRHHTPDGILLFVTQSEARLPHLIAKADRISDFAVFTTYHHVMSDPRGPIWHATDGSIGTID